MPRMSELAPGLSLALMLSTARSLLAGQSVGLIHDVLPAQEIVRRIIADAEAALVALAR